MPLETPYPAKSPKQHFAFIHVVTPREQMGEAIHSAMNELSAALKSQSIRPTGQWFAHHHRPPTETFEFDACFPVDEPLAPVGRISNGEIAETDVIRATYRGNYDGLPQAWSEFRTWITDNGYKTRGDAWEVYTFGPQQSRTPEDWETVLNYPLAS